MSVRIYQHMRSGDRYAIRLQGDVIIGAIGPIHHTEIKSMLEDGIFETDIETLEWICSHITEYNDVTDFEQIAQILYR